MGYRIEYEKPGNLPKQRKKRWTGIAAAILVLLLVIGAITVKAVGLKWVQDVLLPGDPQITAAALETMVKDLRSGESIADAIKAFCQEIIQNAPKE